MFMLCPYCRKVCIYITRDIIRERLLPPSASRYSGILLDTENLTSPKCSSVDKYMSTLLLSGAGRLGCNGLYKILRDKMQDDVSCLNVGQILQKDFKKLTKTELKKLRLLILVFGYHKNFKEMLISGESEDVMEEMLHFIDNHPSCLPLDVLYQSGLSDEMRAFTMDNYASLTIIEQLLQDFCTT